MVGAKPLEGRSTSALATNVTSAFISDKACAVRRHRITSKSNADVSMALISDLTIELSVMSGVAPETVSGVSRHLREAGLAFSERARPGRREGDGTRRGAPVHCTDGGRQGEERTASSRRLRGPGGMEPAEEGRRGLPGPHAAGSRGAGARTSLRRGAGRPDHRLGRTRPCGENGGVRWARKPRGR